MMMMLMLVMMMILKMRTINLRTLLLKADLDLLKALRVDGPSCHRYGSAMAIIRSIMSVV